MALKCERPIRGLCLREVSSCSSVTFAAMVIILFFALAAAEESFPSRLVGPRKQLGSESSGEEAELKVWLEGNAENVWKVVTSRVMRLQSSEAHEWPVLKLGVRTLSGIILGALGAAVSSAAGLGGGILFVPILNAVLLFDSKTSVALSNFMMLGLSAVGSILNLLRRHPNDFSKPLVDFDISLVLQPNMMLGISIGVILNDVLPNWLTTALLMVVLGYMTFDSTKSGLTRWNNETRLANANPKKPSLKLPHTESGKVLTESLLGFCRSAPNRYPVTKILVLLSVWLALFLVLIVRGSHDRQGLIDVQECGVGYWLLTACQIPVTFGVTAWVIYRLHEAAAEPGQSHSEDQSYVLKPKESIFLSVMALVAGVAGGMLGVGGAMIINPLLLSVGVIPQVASATSLFMVFFSSSMSSAEYWLMGRIPVGYALIATLICALSSAAGIVAFQKLVDGSGRPSLIVFSVAGVIGFSAILMAVFGGHNVWDEYQSGAYMAFKYPC